jgi:predicted 3-demethylubiquinone-9 3-methyltransferase (glyoxalase superfamily)
LGTWLEQSIRLRPHPQPFSQSEKEESTGSVANQKETDMQKITPFLWYDNKAEEAANFYCSIFKNSKVQAVTYYEGEGAKASGRPAGTVMTVAVSFVINCETQAEIDSFWDKLTADGGAESQCGWLKDKYGLSWQVVPTILPELFKDKDAEKSQRVMKAMLQMKKLDIATLKEAAEQE